MKNTTTKLTVAEVINLNMELTAGKAALLGQKLSLPVKFHLNNMGKEITTHLETFEKVRKELIETYGTADEKGVKSIEENTENFEKFKDKIAEVLKTEVEFKHPAFTIEDFAGVETDGFYPVLFKILGA